MQLTMQTDLMVGHYYLITLRGRELVGLHVATRGNDEDYPNFKVGMLHADPYIVSVPRVSVVGRMELVDDGKAT
jgi:hypothetical protein